MLKSVPLRFSLVGILLMLAAIRVLAAGPSSSRGPESIGLLVLKSGRFVEGRISQSAGGYVVKKSNGSMVVPFDLVNFPAVDRRDAYLTMRSRMKPLTPDRRMALARWCLTHAMYKETQAELRTVLEIDPRRADARKMLDRLLAILYPNRSRRQPKNRPSPSRTADGFKRPSATSLSGLKPAPAREFVSIIQPILMNKCGNARCHGSAARNRFRLTRIRTGFRSHRVFVERNLAAVLREIDRKRPSQSRLLSVPQKGHGRGGRAIFFGRRGAKQFQLLRTWTLAVAAASSTSPASDPPASSLSGSQKAKRAAVSSTRRGDATSVRPVRSGPPHQPKTRNGAGKTLMPPGMIAPPRSDPFDPDAFNRAVHGHSGKNTPGKPGG